MAPIKLKAGDKVRRLEKYRDWNWEYGSSLMTVKWVSRCGEWLTFEEQEWKAEEYQADKFELVQTAEYLSFKDHLTDSPPRADSVNHPAHYNAGAIETIDYILQVAKQYPGDEAALVGNVIKYVSRAPLKGRKTEDLKKAQWYLNRLIENLSSD